MALLDQVESTSVAGKLRLLLLAALFIIILGIMQAITLAEKLLLAGIFLLVGVSIIWRIQTDRL